MASGERVHRGRAFWAETVAAWEESGQAVAPFCRTRGLAPNTFYKWRRRLAGDAQAACVPALLPVRVVKTRPE